MVFMRFFINVFLVIFLGTFLLVNATPTQAQVYGNDILFKDSFDDNNDFGWVKENTSNNPIDALWTVNNGKYGMYLYSSQSDHGNSVTGDENWTNYQYEFDMYPIKGVDRNFIFKVNKYPNSINDFYYYEIHSSGNWVSFDKVAPVDPNIPYIRPSNYYYPILNGNTYHWRVVSIQNNTKVYVQNLTTNTTEVKLFDFNDNSLPLLKGKIGLRIGTGGSYITEVYFDNIVVKDLRTPVQRVKYFSQIDPLWKDQTYDHLTTTIGNVGCALTSAAMVLSGYGIDILPFPNNETKPLDVANLNSWLNLPENGDSFWRGGLMSWGAISRLTKQLHILDKKYPKLEYTYTGIATMPTTDTILTTRHHPLIAKYSEPLSTSGQHFVTAVGLSPLPDTLLTILDPYNQTHQTLNFNSTPILRYGYFYPTDSDFSYIVMHADKGLYGTLTNPENYKTGVDGNNNFIQQIPESNIYEEFPISGDFDLTYNQPRSFWETGVKKPKTGQYTVSFITSANGTYNYELYFYDQDANYKMFKHSITLNPSEVKLFQFNFDHDNIVNSNDYQPSWESVRQKIRQAYTNGKITSSQTKDQLIKHVTTAEKVFSHNPLDGQEVLKTTATHVLNGYRQEKIINPAQNDINGEIHLLLSYLSLQ